MAVVPPIAAAVRWRNEHYDDYAAVFIEARPVHVPAAAERPPRNAGGGRGAKVLVYVHNRALPTAIDPLITLHVAGGEPPSSGVFTPSASAYVRLRPGDVLDVTVTPVVPAGDAAVYDCDVELRVEVRAASSGSHAALGALRADRLAFNGTLDRCYVSGNAPRRRTYLTMPAVRVSPQTSSEPSVNVVQRGTTTQRVVSTAVSKAPLSEDALRQGVPLLDRLEKYVGRAPNVVGLELEVAPAHTMFNIDLSSGTTGVEPLATLDVFDVTECRRRCMARPDCALFHVQHNATVHCGSAPGCPPEKEVACGKLAAGASPTYGERTDGRTVCTMYDDVGVAVGATVKQEDFCHAAGVPRAWDVGVLHPALPYSSSAARFTATTNYVYGADAQGYVRASAPFIVHGAPVCDGMTQPKTALDLVGTGFAFDLRGRSSHPVALVPPASARVRLYDATRAEIGLVGCNGVPAGVSIDTSVRCGGSRWFQYGNEMQLHADVKAVEIVHVCHATAFSTSFRSSDAAWYLTYDGDVGTRKRQVPSANQTVCTYIDEGGADATMVCAEDALCDPGFEGDAGCRGTVSTLLLTDQYVLPTPAPTLPPTVAPPVGTPSGAGDMSMVPSAAGTPSRGGGGDRGRADVPAGRGGSAAGAIAGGVIAALLCVVCVVVIVVVALVLMKKQRDASARAAGSDASASDGIGSATPLTGITTADDAATVTTDGSDGQMTLELDRGTPRQAAGPSLPPSKELSAATVRGHNEYDSAP
eukprot:CAMPEP_0198315256 /NCGR_PEP_ID=MMETSP1450-20131203/5589_1 /TAXON_ID=753684 ORGANISM="Madagascaria erythrocladiodes, Strain CCMP3234" /NCGR_SAMPLE_ID=MMETSP1450 /ASSEMBLY_ACC=CAM_ASM_001115 /LENGTH=755 /DNA_ID=CAMNT_0044018361 /DNA_START=8 /DNA_END=2271 /DNA_ORIENTATION=+